VRSAQPDADAIFGESVETICGHLLSLIPQK
jgi:hypothetical protein